MLTYKQMLKAKGDQKSSHKYKSRKPDGKGGWLYDYGKGFEKPKGEDKAWSRYASPEDIQSAYASLKLQAYTGPFTIEQSTDGITGQKKFVLTDRDASILTTGGMFMDSRAMSAHGHKRIMFATKEKALKFRKQALNAGLSQPRTVAESDSLHAEVRAYVEKHNEDMKMSITTQEKRMRLNFSQLIKAKGDQKAGHKYKSRKPDGKGAWLYDYGDGKGYRSAKDGAPAPAHAGKTDAKGNQAKGEEKGKHHKVEGLDTAGASDGVKERLSKYNLNVVQEAGSSPEQALDIATRLEEGISKSADICKSKPSVCHGNMGIPRSDMPQIMDDSVKSLLAATNKDGTPDEGERA